MCQVAQNNRRTFVIRTSPILNKQEQVLFGRDVVGFFVTITIYSMYIQCTIVYMFMLFQFV